MNAVASFLADLQRPAAQPEHDLEHCYCCGANFERERFTSFATCIEGARICNTCATEIEHRDHSTTRRTITWYGTKKGRRGLVENTKRIEMPIFAEALR